jgi:hypothetical protein
VGTFLGHPPVDRQHAEERQQHDQQGRQRRQGPGSQGRDPGQVAQGREVIHPGEAHHLPPRVLVGGGLAGLGSLDLLDPVLEHPPGQRPGRRSAADQAVTRFWNHIRDRAHAVDRPPSKASWQRPASPTFYPAWRQVTAQTRTPCPPPPWTCRHPFKPSARAIPVLFGSPVRPGGLPALQLLLSPARELLRRLHDRPVLIPAVVVVRLAVHQPAPDRTLAISLDSAPNLSCTNSTQAHCVDAEHQPTDLAVGCVSPFPSLRLLPLGSQG